MKEETHQENMDRIPIILKKLQKEMNNANKEKNKCKACGQEIRKHRDTRTNNKSIKRRS